tara:strand:+ start:641 stop:952 length:312 start_codon:yes stop_codon:yes gene_type:complete
LGNKFDNLGKPEIYNEKIQKAKNEKEEIFKTNVQNSLNNLNEKVKKIKKDLIEEWEKIYSIANAQYKTMPKTTEAKVINHWDTLYAGVIKPGEKVNDKLSKWK